MAVGDGASHPQSLAERPPATTLFGWALQTWEERLAAAGAVDVTPEDLCHMTWPVHDPPYEETA